MKLPGIFYLTKIEQRVIIVIVAALLAFTIARRYNEHRTQPLPVLPAPNASSTTPAPDSTEEDSGERED